MSSIGKKHTTNDAEARISAPLTLEPCEPSENCFPLGHIVIEGDDPDFRKGYEEGCRQYEAWHAQDQVMDAGLLLALVRNGWGGSRYSDIRQTGYIVGWLRTLFAHAYHVGEVL